MKTPPGCFPLIVFVIAMMSTKTVICRRPLYNIAHMVNSIREVDHYLDRGANALEADIYFNSLGEAKSTYHGSPCDCFRVCTLREDLADYFKYIRKITTPYEKRYRKELALLFLDLKVSDIPTHKKYRAGDTIADQLVNNLWHKGVNKTNINVILSIGHTTDAAVVKGFNDALLARNVEHFHDKIGWDIGLNDPLTKINETWKNLGVQTRRWQGDGSSNCLSFMQNHSRLRKAIAARDKNATFEKVYHWTIDLSSALRNSLREGVDGIITNHPERVKRILKESEFISEYRLAMHRDSPWERIKLWIVKEPSRGQRSMLFSFMGSVVELVNSFGYYVGDSVKIFFRSR